MNRRNLLKMLGLGAIGMALPATQVFATEKRTCFDCHAPTDTTSFQRPGYGNRVFLCREHRIHPFPPVRNWQPNTAYHVGNRVQFSNGKIITVAMAGTSANIEMINGTIVPLKGRI